MWWVRATLFHFLFCYLLLFFRCNLHQFGEGVLRDKASGGCVLVLKVLGYLLFVILPFQCEGYI